MHAACCKPADVQVGIEMRDQMTQKGDDSKWKVSKITLDHNGTTAIPWSFQLVAFKDHKSVGCQYTSMQGVLIKIKE